MWNLFNVLPWRQPEHLLSDVTKMLQSLSPRDGKLNWKFAHFHFLKAFGISLLHLAILPNLFQCLSIGIRERARYGSSNCKYHNVRSYVYTVLRIKLNHVNLNDIFWLTYRMVVRLPIMSFPPMWLSDSRLYDRSQIEVALWAPRCMGTDSQRAALRYSLRGKFINDIPVRFK